MGRPRPYKGNTDRDQRSRLQGQILISGISDPVKCTPDRPGYKGKY
jgi:hypothetical protein